MAGLQMLDQPIAYSARQATSARTNRGDTIRCAHPALSTQVMALVNNARVASHAQLQLEATDRMELSVLMVRTQLQVALTASSASRDSIALLATRRLPVPRA